MLMGKRGRQNGLSLIELMIGIVVGSIVLGAVIAVYASTIRGSNTALRTARLNQELRSTMNIMVRELRRAGFNGWNAAGTIVLSTDNAFAKRGVGGGQTDLRVLNNGTCVLFTYDLANWGAVDADEYMGFRISNGAVQMRRQGTVTNNCNDGSWETLTDPNAVTVTVLTFSTEGSQCMDFTASNGWKLNSASPQPTIPACDAAVSAAAVTANAGAVTVVRGAFALTAAGSQLVDTREIHVTLSGTAAADTAIRATISEEVQVRNDRIYNKP